MPVLLYISMLRAVKAFLIIRFTNLTIGAIFAQHTMKKSEVYCPFCTDLVNWINWTKLDNLGILKQLYHLIYQCLERLKLLELSN